MPKANPWEKIEKARLADLELARRIIANPHGFEGLMLEWAQLMVKKDLQVVARAKQS